MQDRFSTSDVKYLILQVIEALREGTLEQKAMLCRMIPVMVSTSVPLLVWYDSIDIRQIQIQVEVN